MGPGPGREGARRAEPGAPSCCSLFRAWGQAQPDGSGARLAKSGVWLGVRARWEWGAARSGVRPGVGAGPRAGALEGDKAVPSAL